MILIEIGPRLNFSTALSTNAVSICSNIDLRGKISRIEKSTIYLFEFETKNRLTLEKENILVDSMHDKMTEQRYLKPIETFRLPPRKEDWFEIDVLGQGERALKEVSEKLGLAFDDWDIQYYCEMFRDKLRRNPTSVECFDLAQSNSEHSRHWFFKGRIFVNDQEIPDSLIDMVASTQKTTNPNNVIKFNDNSSAIQGFSDLNILIPENSTESSSMEIRKNQTRHIIFTAETHNFPTGVAPFPGATTGTGGRIRDVQAAGRGGHVVAGTAGYSFGNLNIPGYKLEWEDEKEFYPHNFASPLRICIEASNGASDYGNKFGEPILAGFARNFGQRMPDNERIEYIKPIMFTGGIGTIDEKFVKKNVPQLGMNVVKIGGPVYRIGVGGGAASSTEIQGSEGSEDLDFNAVQRGDPEMEQKLNRLIRACIEYSNCNIIESIHDQGAGGNGNVLKEISEPMGARIYCDRFSLGDPTINTLELWGAEYQESNAILVRSENSHILEKISKREKCQVDNVGEITDDNHITLIETNQINGKHPVHLNLEMVLASMPRKIFRFKTKSIVLQPLRIPKDQSLIQSLERVLRLPSVASKRYLTTKVDRCVTGLVAQQQCVGPQHTPLSDYALIALNYFSYRGSVTSIGEQPIKGLIKPEANGQLSVAEAITNMMFCVITELADVKCSGNWMWPAKLEGEGASLVRTCQAMCHLMKQLNIAIDGGKDSLSMAAKVRNANQTEVVKSPGTLVISAYAPVPDIRLKVTPKMSIDGCGLILVRLGPANQFRLGGSALAQVYNQLGNECPDLEDGTSLKNCFNLVQKLITKQICTAGHDISDGGLIVCLLEMSFATDCGLDINLPIKNVQTINLLFAEECGIILEIKENYLSSILKEFHSLNIQAVHIGRAIHQKDLLIRHNNDIIISESMSRLRDIWEETSFELENYQTNPKCVAEERDGLKNRKTPKWRLSFDLSKVNLNIDSHFKKAPKVAVLREEGINGDREMIASFYMVGFDVVDVTVTDLINNSINLDLFSGLIFPGGFSYADVLGSAKGWAATMKYNSTIEYQLQRFRNRKDTFSLGVCNGCQLMGLLGWIGPEFDGTQGTLLAPNDSRRFECRFSSVLIPETTKAIMFNEMKGSVLGVWVAHGEGKFTFKNSSVQESAMKSVSLVYVDDDNQPTIKYPMNPNGSINGVAGICSEDGRHLAMMPHPERATLSWQWPYFTPEFESIKNSMASPWVKMFENAFKWSMNQR
ncbi:proline-rich protein 5-like [Sarcoptes scabiei]|nr:proline-rich protein 5-like [Sarcoptes scabiei]